MLLSKTQACSSGFQISKSGLTGNLCIFHSLIYLNQRCPTSSPWAACGPGECFVRPSLGFCCSRSILHTDNFSLFWQPWIWHFWCRCLLNATLSRL